MRGRHSAEVIDRAEQLFCFEGCSTGIVAAQLGAPDRTVRYWCSKFGWHEKRERVREALSTIRMNRLLFRAGLLEKCVSSLNPRDAFAVASLESAAGKQGATGEGGGFRPVFDTASSMSSTEEAIEIIKGIIEAQLNRGLLDPGKLNFSAMRDLVKLLMLADQMESHMWRSRRWGKEGLTDEKAAEIRRKILGWSVEQFYGYKDDEGPIAGDPGAGSGEMG